MHKPLLAFLALGAALPAAQAAVVLSTDSREVRDFQQGLRVETFESVPDRTVRSMARYTSGIQLNEDNQVYDQVQGVRFSVGGTVGVNRPGLYRLQETLAPDARSPAAVLGTVYLDGRTMFNDFGLMEVFFPTLVSAAGFWLNPALGGAKVYAVNTLFAFSQQDEVVLEEAVVDPGGFVGFSYATARIGGLKIIGLGVPDPEDPGARFGVGFTIDDLSYGSRNQTVPTPGTLGLLAASLPLVLLSLGRGRRRVVP